ncbi:HPr family phosphocarrier protein [Natronoglycomyces albus]|uniref:HPr family phosphocarrier protein n=1 Tax=Natronoglycomyces albus TaxID=2811108 RepID=A0A895XPQ9_9ACTN|nr:HPr family phosphocarrier protein [Natronoglycomyces albus]QSB05722.1 HPr family phosphocarrier protein [Natronoglycomyces albus]
MSVRRVRVSAEAGIKARAATIFVETAGSSDDDVLIRRVEGPTLDAKSILHVLSLDIGQGDHIELESDDEAVLAALVELADPAAEAGAEPSPPPSP